MIPQKRRSLWRGVCRVITGAHSGQVAQRPATVSPRAKTDIPRMGVAVIVTTKMQPATTNQL